MSVSPSPLVKPFASFTLPLKTTSASASVMINAAPVPSPSGVRSPIEPLNAMLSLFASIVKSNAPLSESLNTTELSAVPLPLSIVMLDLSLTGLSKVTSAPASPALMFALASIPPPAVIVRASSRVAPIMPVSFATPDVPALIVKSRSFVAMSALTAAKITSAPSGFTPLPVESSVTFVVSCSVPPPRSIVD